MLRRHIFLIISLLTLILSTIGCESLTNKERGPRVDYFRIITSCKDGEADTGAMVSGVKSTLIVFFSTENVYQEFEADMTITSSDIPNGLSPGIHPLVTFVIFKVDKEKGKASGQMQAKFVLAPKCYGEGSYLLNVVIKDGNDRTGVFQAGIAQSKSSVSGSQMCQCSYQCGACRDVDELVSHDERCNCGCTFVGEKCP